MRLRTTHGAARSAWLVLLPWLALAGSSPPAAAPLNGNTCCSAQTCIDSPAPDCAAAGGLPGHCRVGEPCGAPTCNAGAIAPIVNLRATKTRFWSDLLLRFDPDPNADSYDLAYVAQKNQIPACPGCPGAAIVEGSAPTTIAEAIHQRATFGQGGTVWFYDAIGACSQTAVGACCIDTSCSTLRLAGCLAVGGVYRGDGSTCSPDPCVGGACCQSGACTFGAAADCAAAGGSYQGDRTSCTPVNPCVPEPVGACCLLTDCRIETGSECVSRGGSYRGNGTLCTPSPCPRPGVCCTGSACTPGTLAQCQALGGIWSSSRTACSPNPCATGACCIEGGCILRHADDCTRLGGTYRGDDVLCVPDPCAATGACCIGSGCVVDSAANCASSGGTYQGDGVPCGPTTCVVPVGACCRGNVCTSETQAQCTGSGGTYQGDGTGCAPLNPCR